MKQLQLRNGDFVVGPGGFAVVRGAAKIQQDLGAALRETLGDDRFHPRLGTILGDAVGGIQGEEAQMMIQSEISRVIANYMAVQTAQINADTSAGIRSRYTPDEIVSSVGGIAVQQTYDRINVKVSVTTAQGDTVTLLRSVGV